LLLTIRVGKTVVVYLRPCNSTTWKEALVMAKKAKSATASRGAAAKKTAATSKRSEAAKKGALTRKRNAAAKKAAATRQKKKAKA
jgi:hypothetical protein